MPEVWAMPIHRPAPEYDELVEPKIFETGIKGHRPDRPFVKGGKTGLFGGAGAGKTVIIRSSSTTWLRSTAALPCSPALVSVPVRVPICTWR